jgi:hypothetical protein
MMVGVSGGSWLIRGNVVLAVSGLKEITYDIVVASQD